MLDLRTPPLLRARTCSIVLSACRGDELENVRACACTPFVRRTPPNAFSSTVHVHCVLLPAVAREKVVDFELWIEAKLRRAQVWADWRSAGDDLRARAAPATQLDVDDIVTAVVNVDKLAVDVGSRPAMLRDFSRCDDRASVHGPPSSPRASGEILSLDFRFFNQL